MKRRKMPGREVAVCKRFREARQQLGLTQPVVANELKISRDRVAASENLRSPLRWRNGFVFCVHFGISLEWLATGKGEIRDDPASLDNLFALMVDIPDSVSFGSAYDNFIVPEMARTLSSVAKNLGAARKGRERLMEIAEFWSRNVPDSAIQDFAEVLWQIGEYIRPNAGKAGFRSFLLRKSRVEK